MVQWRQRPEGRYPDNEVGFKYHTVAVTAGPVHRLREFTHVKAEAPRRRQAIDATDSERHAHGEGTAHQGSSASETRSCNNQGEVGTTVRVLRSPLNEIEEADTFLSDFMPRKDVDYSWVVALTIRRYDHSRAVAKVIDDKATQLMTQVGGGAGVLLTASIAAVTAGGVSPWVVGSATLAFFAAVYSLAMAARCRCPGPSYPPPAGRNATAVAEQYTPDGEAAMIPVWNRAAVMNDAQSLRKAATLTKAVRGMVVAVGLLLLPLVVGIGVRAWYGPPTAPAPAATAHP